MVRLAVALPIALAAVGYSSTDSAAATKTYQMRGALLTDCIDGCDVTVPPGPDILNGTIKINEDLLSGGSLSNTSVFWRVEACTPDPFGPDTGCVPISGDYGLRYSGENLDSIVFDGYFFEEMPLFHSEFQLKTDDRGRPVSWSISIADSSGDLVHMPTLLAWRLSVSGANPSWEGEPGRLSLVPLPATLPMLLSALAAAVLYLRSQFQRRGRDARSRVWAST